MRDVLCDDADNALGTVERHSVPASVIWKTSGASDAGLAPHVSGEAIARAGHRCSRGYANTLRTAPAIR